MNKKTHTFMLLACMGLAIPHVLAADYPDVKVGPVFTAKGELVQPKNFRNWVFLGSPLTPNALNNGEAPFPEYHNVYVESSTLEQYKKSGKWPEGTMMVKELHLTVPGQEADGSRREVSGRGYFPGEAHGLDVAVKDSKRFANTKNWGYFNFGHHAPPYAATTAEQPKDSCAGCHIANAPEDMVYMQFYRPIINDLPTK